MTVVVLNVALSVVPLVLVSSCWEEDGFPLPKLKDNDVAVVVLNVAFSVVPLVLVSSCWEEGGCPLSKWKDNDVAIVVLNVALSVVVVDGKRMRKGGSVCFERILLRDFCRSKRPKFCSPSGSLSASSNRCSEPRSDSLSTVVALSRLNWLGCWGEIRLNLRGDSFLNFERQILP